VVVIKKTQFLKFWWTRASSKREIRKRKRRRDNDNTAAVAPILTAKEANAARAAKAAKAGKATTSQKREGVVPTDRTKWSEELSKCILDVEGASEVCSHCLQKFT